MAASFFPPSCTRRKDDLYLTFLNWWNFCTSDCAPFPCHFQYRLILHTRPISSSHVDFVTEFHFFSRLPLPPPSSASSCRASSYAATPPDDCTLFSLILIYSFFPFPMPYFPDWRVYLYENNEFPSFIFPATPSTCAITGDLAAFYPANACSL